MKKVPDTFSDVKMKKVPDTFSLHFSIDFILWHLFLIQEKRIIRPRRDREIKRRR